MGVESWFVETVLKDKPHIPDFALQFIIDHYLTFDNEKERVFNTSINPAPLETEEIAVRSRELMENHYNMPLEMFENFLGRTMKYSAALWDTGATTLDEAQECMMDDLCQKIGMKDGDRLLDIGCGFGSFPAHVLRRYPNSKVYGLTLSRTQADYMRARQTEQGHPLGSDRFYLIHDDFNNVSFDQPFDRVVSIGVFEHISNLSRALEKIRSFIVDQGTLLLHYISYHPFPGREPIPRQDTFLNRYIFPGGRVWAQTELGRHQSHFRIEREWFLNGVNYRKTIQAWLTNYLANTKIFEDQLNLSKRNIRLWELYLRICTAIFRLRGGTYYGNGQFLLKPI